MSEVNNQIAFKEFIKTIFCADDPILENWQPQAFAEYYSSLYKDFVNGYSEFIKTYYSQELPERIEDEFYEYAKNLWDIQQTKLNKITKQLEQANELQLTPYLHNLATESVKEELDEFQLVDAMYEYLEQHHADTTDEEAEQMVNDKISNIAVFTHQAIIQGRLKGSKG